MSDISCEPSDEMENLLSIFSSKHDIKKVVVEALLMSTHKVGFRGEIRKILCGYPLLPVAMYLTEMCLTSDHNICFCGEIKKNISIFLVEKMPYQEVLADCVLIFHRK